MTEWSYTSVLGRMLTDRADLMVWLDLPRWQVTLQVLRRTLKRRLPRPQQLWNGNVEPPLHTFFTDPEHVARYAIIHHSQKRRKVLRLADNRRDLTTDAGIDLDDIRDIFADTAPAAAVNHDVAIVLRMRTPGGRMGLLSDLVTSRLKNLPEGSLRQADLDNLLIIERIFSPLGAAVNASRYIALGTHPDLRELSDRVEAVEEKLDDTIAVDDPRVAQVAAERHAFEQALNAVIEDSGLTEDEDAIFEYWDALHPASADEGQDGAGQDACAGQDPTSVTDAIGKMPYDYSPARLRCMELAEEIAANESPAS